jgi:hypothetical protein
MFLEPHHVAQMGLVGELGIHRHRSTPMCLLGVRGVGGKLRKKLASASGGKDYIETAWGRGYVLREPSEDEARIAVGARMPTRARPPRGAKLRRPHTALSCPPPLRCPHAGWAS